MYLQTQFVTKHSKNGLQGSGFQAEGKNLVVKLEEDDIHLLVLDGNVAQGPALSLKLG